MERAQPPVASTQGPNVLVLGHVTNHRTLSPSPAVLSFSMWRYVIYVILLGINVDWSDNLGFDNWLALQPKVVADCLGRILVIKL